MNILRRLWDRWVEHHRRAGIVARARARYPRDTIWWDGDALVLEQLRMEGDYEHPVQTTIYRDNVVGSESVDDAMLLSIGHDFDGDHRCRNCYWTVEQIWKDWSKRDCLTTGSVHPFDAMLSGAWRECRCPQCLRKASPYRASAPRPPDLSSRPDMSPKSIRQLIDSLLLRLPMEHPKRSREHVYCHECGDPLAETEELGHRPWCKNGGES